MARGNFTSGAERYNKRLHKIFDNAIILKAKVRIEQIKYLKTIGYNSPGIDTYSDDVVGTLYWNHKNN